MRTHVGANPPAGAAVSPRDDLEGRLGRIAGQVRGIQRMAAGDRVPEDLLLQLSAVQAALLEAATLVLRRHIGRCVEGICPGSAGERKNLTEELMRGLSRYARTRRDLLPASKDDPTP